MRRHARCVLLFDE